MERVLVDIGTDNGDFAIGFWDMACSFAFGAPCQLDRAACCPDIASSQNFSISCCGGLAAL
jgi:hypothetical protein